MRRQMTFLVAVTTSSVILAFLVPLAILLRTLVASGAVQRASFQAQQMSANSTPFLSSPALLEQLKNNVKTLLGPQRDGITSLILPSGEVLGPSVDLKDPLYLLAKDGTPQSHTYSDHAVVFIPSLTNNGTLVVKVLVPGSKLHAGASQASGTIGGLALLLILASVLAADRLARRMTRPIQQVVRAADEMRSGHLDIRVAEGQGPPEVQALAGALNRLAGRIQDLLVAERDAVADLSHRLRTPVTALRLDADSVTDPDVGERLRGHIANLERTVDAIVHDAKRPTQATVNASCEIGRVVSERVNFWSALADDQGRSFTYAIPDHSLRIRLDARDLADVVDVLIDNAFAHTDEGTAIEIWVVPRADGNVVLTIEDAGLGLPAGDIVARGASGGGSSGLGLDIVRRAAIASGGGLELGRSRLGGALFRVVFGRARA
jgi:signal transduction histidine kinase